VEYLLKPYKFHILQQKREVGGRWLIGECRIYSHKYEENCLFGGLFVAPNFSCCLIVFVLIIEGGGR
jgi:hypothetical protein